MPCEEDDIVLRIIDGDSVCHERVFRGGTAEPPFALGTTSSWSVRGSLVAPNHVLLAFNGTKLFACVAQGESAWLGQNALGSTWEEITTPTTLRFGSVRMSVGRRAGPEDPTTVPSVREPDAAPVSTSSWAQVGDDEFTTLIEDDSVSDLGDVTLIAESALPSAAMGPTSNEPTTPPSPPLPHARPSPPTLRVVRKAPEPARETPPSTAAVAPRRTLVIPSKPLELSTRQVDPRATARLALWAHRTTASTPPLAAAGARSPFASASKTEPCEASDGPPVAPLEFATAPVTKPVAEFRPKATRRIDHRPSAVTPDPGSISPVARAVDTNPRSHVPPTLEIPASPVQPAASHGVREGLVAPPHAEPRFRGEVEAPTHARRELSNEWLNASLPRKVAVLVVPSVLLSVVLFIVGLAGAPQNRQPHAGTDSATTAPARVLMTPAAGDKPERNGAPPAVPSKSAAERGTASLARDSRTAERRAIDAVAAGDPTAAAEQYEALARGAPDQHAFSEAARILRARTVPQAATLP